MSNMTSSNFLLVSVWLETVVQRSKHDRKARKKHRSKRPSSSEGEETISDDDEARVSKVTCLGMQRY